MKVIVFEIPIVYFVLKSRTAKCFSTKSHKHFYSFRKKNGARMLSLLNCQELLRKTVYLSKIQGQRFPSWSHLKVFLNPSVQVTSPEVWIISVGIDGCQLLNKAFQGILMCCQCQVIILGKLFSKWNSRPAASVSPGTCNKCKVSRYRSTESETLKKELRNLCFNKPCRCFLIPRKVWKLQLQAFFSPRKKVALSKVIEP